MRLIRDSPAYFIFIIGFCPFINCLGVHQQDHRPGITNQFKYVEKYQLLGGTYIISLYPIFALENCLRWKASSCLCVQLQ